MPPVVLAQTTTWVAVIATVAAAGALLLDLARSRPPDPLRRSRLVGAALACVLYLAHAVVVDSVVIGTGSATVDGLVLDWLVGHRLGPLTWLFVQISVVGGTVGMGVLATVTAAVVWTRGHRRAALGAIVATGGAILLFNAVKALYGRARPPLGVQVVPQLSPSLPSGHALVSIVAVGMAVVLLGSRLPTRRHRVLFAVAGGLLVAAIGASRLYLGVHWLSDVIAGWLLGGAWLVLWATVLRPCLSNRGAPATGPRAGGHTVGSEKARNTVDLPKEDHS